MATSYRRLTYRDYDASALVTALNSSIAGAWQGMQSYRKSAKQYPRGDFLNELYRHMAREQRVALMALLEVRRQARES